MNFTHFQLTDSERSTNDTIQSKFNELADQMATAGNMSSIELAELKEKYNAAMKENEDFRKRIAVENGIDPETIIAIMDGDVFYKVKQGNTPL